MLDLPTIEERIRRHRAVGISPDEAPRRAAVAVVLRPGERGAEILLMQRSERAGDRWSGQVSLPGGREEPGDSTLVATAIRETREEVAVDLSVGAEHIGALDAIAARSKSGPAGLSVWPFVFSARSELEPLPSLEAQSVFWLPLSLVVQGELDGIYPYDFGQRNIDLPCWRYQGRTIWGMTHKMLSDFIALVSKQ